MTSVTETKTGAETIRWDLKDLYNSPQDPRIKSELAETKTKAEAFLNTYKEKLHTLTPEALKKAYTEIEALLFPVYKISQYVNLLYSTDTASDEIKALVAYVDEAETDIHNLLLFFELELGAMPADQAKSFINAAGLEPYGYSYSRTRATSKYNLSEKEEQLITIKDLTGTNAWQKLYSELTSGFQFEFEYDGQKRQLNGSQLRALRQHADPNVRRRAMALFFSRYEENELTLTHIFNNVVKDYALEKNLRGYTSAISIRNIGNDLSEAAVESLHQVTTESYTLVQRYYSLKAKLIGQDLTLADIYAPLPKATKTYTWDESKQLVLDSFYGFDKELGGMVEELFTENRIDAPITPTKRGGAFCSSSTPDIKPYVLLNFLGRQRDVSTMAHEFGHAVHDRLCEKQPLSYYHPILPLAETASVFAEMMLTDKLLKSETDPLAKQALLTDKLEDIFATSHRQNMFSRFEIGTHSMINEKLMSSKDLCSLYQNELKLMFGNAVTYTPEYAWEWSSIPHIYESPFYVYAYNFGNLLVMALYQQYLEEGQDFIPRYKQFLSMGRSASPKDITALIRADIEHPDFWRKSLKYIESLLVQLEGLCKV
jgi:oligoendopeptidase F